LVVVLLVVKMMKTRLTVSLCWLLIMVSILSFMLANAPSIKHFLSLSLAVLLAAAAVEGSIL